jgi:hypothetical protein
MSAVEQAKWHADFNVKFGILREAYPEFHIPVFDDTVTLEVKHNHYERYVKQIHVDNSVGTYKAYLLIMLACIELFCVKVLGLDLGGYTFNQLALMNRYEKLLVELGEKSYGSVGSSWPVEARIIFMTLINAVIFLVIRLVASYLGGGLGDIMQQIVNSYLNQEDPSDHIKRGQRIALRSDGSAEEPETVPEVPAKRSGGGGFDIGSLIGGLGGLFGGGNNRQQRGRASRRATYTE